MLGAFYDFTDWSMFYLYVVRLDAFTTHRDLTRVACTLYPSWITESLNEVNVGSLFSFEMFLCLTMPLVQVMVCHLLSTKPLPEPMLTSIWRLCDSIQCCLCLSSLALWCRNCADAIAQMSGETLWCIKSIRVYIHHGVIPEFCAIVSAQFRHQSASDDEHKKHWMQSQCNDSRDPFAFLPRNPTLRQPFYS